MSKGTKKLLAVMLSLVMMLITLSGCGAPASTTDTSKAAEQTTVAATTQPPKDEIKPVTITFSEQDDPNAQDPTWDEIIKAFQDANPAITVKRTHAETEGQRTDWQNSVLAGAGPEVISAPHDDVGLFSAANTCLQLDNFMPADFWNTLDKAAIDSIKIGGKMYCIPYKVGNTLTLVYNKKYITDPPKTMDELIAKAKELTKAPDFYGLVFDEVEPFFIIPYLGGFGGKVFDESGKPTLDTDAMKKLVQLVYDMKFTHKIIPTEGNTDVANGLFNEGKAAMIINGPWFYSQAKNAGIDYGVANIPQVTGGTWPAPYTGLKVFMVNPNIKDDNTKKAVVKFLEYVNSKDVQLKLAKMSTEVPTNLEAQKDPYVTSDPGVKAMNDQMKVGTPMPYQPEMRAVWDSMKIVMQQVLGGQMKPEDAPKAMQDACLKEIKDQFGKTYN